jgi:pyruvate/2-oxoglutarate dehydrogenase complex dihydrolipoamide dehydrogenase (E3) component
MTSTKNEDDMQKLEHFDILILGSGAAGKLLAWNLGGAGKRVAVVERRWIGGACPNVACLPTKNEVASARVAHIARTAAKFGTAVGPISVDMTKVRARKNTMVDMELDLHLNAFKGSNTELVIGAGRFVAPNQIEVVQNDGGVRQLTADQIVINVGTHAAIPNIPGLIQANPLTHVELLELDYAPKQLVVIGGGYIGLEMAQTFRRFGSEVTVIESGKQLMAREDGDVADEMRRIMEAEGIKFMLGCQIVRVEGQSGRAVRVHVRDGATEHVVEGSDLLVAAGRAPNTAEIGLEKAGIEVDGRGFIRVTERLQTSAPNVWAAGECAGSPFFTHVSADDFRIVMSNLNGGPRHTGDRIVPSCVFTDPPLARVGMNEREAAEQGLTVRKAVLPMANVLRTAATGESQGFMKVLVSAQDDTIVGFTMIGSEAGEVMTVVHIAMIAKLPYTKLRDAVIAHLTMSEGLGPLLGRVPQKS